MIIIDVPMYIKKYKKLDGDIKNFKIGFQEIKKCDINKSFDYWKEEIPWLSGYFTFGVWFCFYIFSVNFKYKSLKD